MMVEGKKERLPSCDVTPLLFFDSLIRLLFDVLKDVLKDVHKDVLKELTERQVVILETICTSSDVTQQEMSTKLKVSKKTIQREFDAIRKLGININRQDGRKEGEWVIKTEK